MKNPGLVKSHISALPPKLPLLKDNNGLEKVYGRLNNYSDEDANLTAIIENVDGCVWHIDKEHRYLAFNSEMRQKIKEVFAVEIRKGDKAIAVLESMDPSKKLQWEKLYELGFKGQPQRVVMEFTLDKTFFLDISLTPIWKNKAIIGLSCFARDVTGEMLGKKQLNEANSRFRSLIENSHDGIVLLGEKGKINYVTGSVNRILGYEKDEMIGMDPVRVCHPHDKVRVIAALDDLLHHPGNTATITYRMLHKNGSWRTLRANITNMLHEEGVKALVFNFKDVTESIQANEQLLKSEANLRGIFENTNTAYLLIDVNYNIVAFNQRAAAWIKYESGKDLLQGTYYPDYIRKENREDSRKVFARVLKGIKLQYPRRGQKINGKTKWYYVGLQRIANGIGETLGISFSILDITERKEAEEHLRDSESLYRSLFNNSPLPKFVCDQKTLCYLEVNEMAVKHYGYSREEFLTMSAHDLRKPEDQPELQKLSRSRNVKEYNSSVVRHVKKNGEIIFVEVVAHPLIYKGQKAYLMIAHDISEILRLQKELTEEKVNKQIEITRATLAIQEKERNEVGKELHDNVNQMLATAKLYLETYKYDPKKFSGLLVKSMNTINDSILEIRNISKSLVPPSLGDISLKESLEELAINLRLTGKSVKLRCKDIHEDKLSEGLKISVYRIVQEQLNNIQKYAKASTVIISLKQDIDQLELSIADNGVGFDTAKKRKGIGITNIMNRAATFNGKLIIESSPGQGCRLHVCFSLS